MTVEDYITSYRICDMVAGMVEIDMNDLFIKTRREGFSHPRHVAMALMREHTTLSLKQIAEFFGLRDHTIVCHAVKTIIHTHRWDRRLELFTMIDQKLRQNIREQESKGALALKATATN